MSAYYMAQNGMGLRERGVKGGRQREKRRNERGREKQMGEEGRGGERRKKERKAGG